METTAKNNTSGTHQEKAKKLRKLRRWQIAVSLLGAAIVVWGVIEVVCLFLDYKQTEVSNDAQNRTVYLSHQPACIGLYQGRFISPSIRKYAKATRCLYWTTANIRYA